MQARRPSEAADAVCALTSMPGAPVEATGLRSIAGWLKAQGADGFLAAEVADAIGIPRDTGVELLAARQRGFRERVLKQLGARRGVFDDSAARRQIAMQHRHCAFRLDRIVARADRVLAGYLFRRRDDLAQARAGDGLGIEIDEVAKLSHQFRHAAGMVKVLHVMLARRL